MNNEEMRKKEEIISALAAMSTGDFLETSKHLLAVLDYRSERTVELPGTAEDFIQRFPARHRNTETEMEFLDSVESVELVFQVTNEEIVPNDQPTLFESPAFDEGYVRSFMFFAIELKDSDYPRGKYAQFTREINKRFMMPIVVLFRVKDRLTIGFVGRRQHRLNPDRDVLEHVTLIKDIHMEDPHRAHIDILFELSLVKCAQWMTDNKQPKNFEGLLAAWLARLDTSELNKRFFQELANWYFWAVDQVRFPEDAGEDIEVRNATSVIRLLTRLIFVWFIREKGLVPDALFNPNDLEDILDSLDPQESTYYKAILQNLFFATLNQEMNTPQKPNTRKFRGEGRQHYNITSLYRYKDYFADPDEALRKFETIPFLNGGLFECLDGPSKEDSTRMLRVDGFSDRDDNPLHVPNELFFSDEQTVNLNAAYGTRGKKHKVRGLINILDRYKFTIAENTPIEEEVALDPELLGKVFENLLAAYNPETEATARKQTGSYYTPREIVNYMTEESLIAYLQNALTTYSESQRTFSVTTPPSQLDFAKKADPVQRELDVETVSLSDEAKAAIEDKLRELFAYNEEPNPLNGAETEVSIKAIDTLKILDPAAGSGAFPMGVLHRLAFILGKLDPGNVQWKERQIERADAIPDPIARKNATDDIEAAFKRNELDYGRKLYLIENCIYGVDIQPIATQIAKLRFFISLIVDQQIDDSLDNRGVRPLPNLETKFVTANTLFSVDKPLQMTIGDTEIDQKEKELEEVRRRHFIARTPKTKRKYRGLDTQIRTEISELLEERKNLSPNEANRIANWDPYDQNTSADFFDPEWMFGIRDGFDITIGNPPYISIENLPSTMKNYLFENYQACKGRTDIYIAFLEKSVAILNTKGIMCFILPSAFATQRYGEKMRHILIKNHTIREIVDASSYRIFENAVVYNIILIVDNHKGQDQTKVRIHNSNADFDMRGGKEFFVDQHAFAELKDSRFETNSLVFNNLKLKEKIWQRAVRFDEICFIAYGARLNHRSEKLGKKHYITQSQISEGKRFCEGKNIERYSFSQEGWLNYTPNEHYNPMFPELFENKKLMFIRIVKDYLRFAYDDEGFYNSHTVINCVRLDLLSGVSHISARRAVRRSDSKFSKQFDYKFLLGFLNSVFTNWYFRNFLSDKLNFYPNAAKTLPIPNVTPNQQLPVIEFVDQILDAKRANSDADVSDIENEIDQIVYSLYDLTPDEIQIVEGAENV